MPFHARRRALPLVYALLVLALASCQRKHVPVASVPELPYPSCGEGELPAGEVVASGRLRPGPTSLEKNIDERYEIRRRDCLYVATVRQEWPLGTADVDVVFDADLLPVRVWKRMTLPGVQREDGNADIRRYELRTPEVTIKRRTPKGELEYEILRGARPRAVIGPGRGLLTMWIRRARLAEGAKVRESVLDFREPVEIIRDVTLRRDPDMFLPWLGRTVRVYTVYGRETVFADETDAVIGDLAGLRPHELAGTPVPAPMPMYGTPDPVHTP